MQKCEPENLAIVRDFILRATRDLAAYLTASGRVLDSEPSTLCAGDMYILGIHPAGDPERMADKTISSSLSGLPTQRNNFLDEAWDRNGLQLKPGTARIQRRVRAMCDEIGVDLRNVCASNLVFMRTTASKFVNPEWLDVCWRVHELVLNIVRPRLILTLGCGQLPFEYLCTKLGARREIEHLPSGHPGAACKLTEVWVARQPCLLFGMPQPSRFLLTDESTLARLKTMAGDFRTLRGGGPSSPQAIDAPGRD